MRKHLVWAAIAGLALPLASICVAADVAAIRTVAILRSAATEGFDRGGAPGYMAKPAETAAAKAVPR